MGAAAYDKDCNSEYLWEHAKGDAAAQPPSSLKNDREHDTFEASDGRVTGQEKRRLYVKNMDTSSKISHKNDPETIIQTYQQTTTDAKRSSRLKTRIHQSPAQFQRRKSNTKLTSPFYQKNSNRTDQLAASNDFVEQNKRKQELSLARQNLASLEPHVINPHINIEDGVDSEDDRRNN